jgi:hypothetical protein
MAKKLILTRPKTQFTVNPKKKQTKINLTVPNLGNFDLTKYQNYLNLLLGTVFVVMVGKTIAPNFNPTSVVPKFGDTSAPVFGSSKGQTVSFGFEVTSKTDPKYIQDAMKGVSGVMIVTDAQGNLIAGKGADTPMEPMSIAKLITAYAVVQAKGLDTKLPEFGNKTVKTVVATMLDKSHNETAEDLASLVGLDNVQALARTASGNPNLVIGNGSGCNGGNFGTGQIGCDKPGAKTTLITPREMNKINIAFNSELKRQGSSFQSLTGTFDQVGSSGQHRFYQPADKASWGSAKDLKIAIKTGTASRNPFFSIAGNLINKNGEELYFTSMNPGDHTTVWNMEVDLMKAIHESNASNKTQ